MEITDVGGGPGRVCLGTMLNTAAARPLAGQLAAARGADLLVDASAVQHLGALCSQVLASAALTWQADKARLAFVNPSSAFLEGARLLGFQFLAPSREAH